MNPIEEHLLGARRPTGIGPGERLQAARIQQGLSLEDVASRMHLSIGILEAIEENDFDEITAPIFVKGYLRAYARIVSLDEDEMIQQYLEYYSNEDPPISSTSNMAPEMSVADARFKWMTFLVVIALAAMIGAWWWSQRQGGEAPISLDAQAPTVAPQDEADGGVARGTIEAASASRDDESASPIEAPATAVEAPAVEAPAAAAPAVVTPAVEAPAVEAPAVETPAVETPAVETPAVAAAPAPASETAGDSDAAAAAPPAPATEIVALQIAPSGSDRLVVIVHADSWTDVKDANEHQLLYDLMRADESVELIGQAPFSVFLGNGHGVELRFNDEEINFASRIRDDNTARIKIGQ